MDYSDSMPSDRQLLNFIVEKDLLNRLDDFRFHNRFATRAGAIKWLLDWALEQGAKPDRIQVHVTAPAPALPAREELAQPAIIHPVAAQPTISQPPQVVSNGKAEPSHESVIQALKAQGYEVGETAVQEGQVRIVVRSTDCSALVTVGKELHELAAGRLSLGQLAARRRGA
jgi:hypothetical protein